MTSARETSQDSLGRIYAVTPKLTYSVNDAIGMLSLGRSTVYKMLKTGELTNFLWHGRRLIRREDMIAAVDQASGKGAAVDLGPLHDDERTPKQPARRTRRQSRG